LCIHLRGPPSNEISSIGYLANMGFSDTSTSNYLDAAQVETLYKRVYEKYPLTFELTEDDPWYGTEQYSMWDIDGQEKSEPTFVPEAFRDIADALAALSVTKEKFDTLKTSQEEPVHSICPDVMQNLADVKTLSDSYAEEFNMDGKKVDAPSDFVIGSCAMTCLLNVKSMMTSRKKAKEVVVGIGNLSRLSLPHIGDFYHLADSLGDFRVEDHRLGFRLYGLSDLCRSYLRAATHLHNLVGGKPDGEEVDEIFRRAWIPTRRGDEHTKFVLANRIARNLRLRGHDVETLSIANSLFRGNGYKPPWFELFTKEERDMFSWLLNISPYLKTWVNIFRSPLGEKRLKWLGLEWKNPDDDHIDYGIDYDYAIRVIAEWWQKMVPTLEASFKLYTGATYGFIGGSSKQLVCHEYGGGVRARPERVETKYGFVIYNVSVMDPEKRAVSFKPKKDYQRFKSHVKRWVKTKL